jgi:hypothetical protein
MMAGNELESATFPLLEKEGWLRHQSKVAKPPKRRRRGGQLGEILRPQHFRRTDHPGRAISEGIHCLVARPPLLLKEGKRAPGSNST